MKRKAIDFPGLALAFVLLPCTALAFDSGSTGVDGDFNPTVSVEIVLPASGVLNYRSVNIPAGVTVSFKRNAINTPVVMLVQTDATIAGNIALDGETSPATGGEGDANLFDDGQPGRGGPGGFDGGFGGIPERNRVGGDGLGPGGGGGGRLGAYDQFNNPAPGCGGGSGFAQEGVGSSGYRCQGCDSAGGAPYGSETLKPLVGGSGGGGGAGGTRFRGSGGGGGGGAMLLAATGTVQLTGRISAVGGSSGNSDRDGDVTAGGAGSGGAIRIVGTHLNGDGTVDVHGPDRGFAYLATPWGARNCIGGSGSPGRIRLEAEVYRFQGSTPGTIATIGTPSTLFLETGPILKFLSVAGLPVPEAPTGINDVTIPSGTSDPINVTVGTLNVPVGTIVRVMMVPQVGPAVGVDNAPTTGTDVSASTQIALNIPSGASTLQASATYTVVASVGDALSRFAQGERVERVTLTSTLGQGNKAIWHTIAGRQFDVEPALLKLAAFAQ